MTDEVRYEVVWPNTFWANIWARFTVMIGINQPTIHISFVQDDSKADQWQSAYRKWVATPLNKEEEALMNEDLEWIAEAHKAFTK